MGGKRPADESIHPSRRQGIDLSEPRSKKARHARVQKPPNARSVNALKGEIRNLTRLLDRTDKLPADVRVEKERALETHKAELEETLAAKRRSEMISTYHMVRFFERQKATRALKKRRKALSAAAPAAPEHAALQAAVHEAEIDLNYTRYCPLAEKYQSLYPRGGRHPAGDEAGGGRRETADRPALWHVVERATAEGTLEALRDGTARAVAVAVGEKAAKHGGGDKAVEMPTPMPKEERDDVSDGGFFEE